MKDSALQSYRDWLSSKCHASICDLPGAKCQLGRKYFIGSTAILYVLALTRDSELLFTKLDRGVLDFCLLWVMGRFDWLKLGACGDIDRAERIPAIGSEPSQEMSINNTRSEV